MERPLIRVAYMQLITRRGRNRCKIRESKAKQYLKKN